MTQKKDSTIAALAVAGAAVAGSLLGAAGAFLSNKNNQDKVKKALNDFSKEASKTGQTIKKKVDEITVKASSKPQAKKPAVTKTTPAPKASTQPAVKKAPARRAPVKKAAAKTAPKKTETSK